MQKKQKKISPLPTIIVSAVVIISIVIINATVTYRNIESCFKLYAALAIIAYFALIVASKKASGRFTLFHLFLVITFLFYFGGQTLVLLGYYNRLSTRIFSVLDDRIPIESKVQAMTFILCCISLISVGYSITISRRIKRNKTDHSIKKSLSSQSVLRFGLILLIITIIPTFVSLIRSASINSSLGHLEYRAEKAGETGIWFVCSYLSGWFRPACFMVIIAAGSNKKALPGYLGIAGYSLLYLLTGSRYQVIEIAVCLFAIIIYWKHKKISLKTVVKVALAAYLLVVVLKAVGYVRTEGIGSSFFNFEVLKDIIGDSLIYEVLYTTSTTFTTISNVMYCCPSQVPFNSMGSYIGAFFYMLPNSFRPSIVSEINIDVEQVFSPLYYNWTTSGYGSSFLAEMYFNMGYYSYIACVIYGALIAILVDRINTAQKRKDSFAFFACVYIFGELIWGIRSDLYLVPRHILLYIVIPYIVIRLLYGTERKRLISFKEHLYA